MVAPGGSMRFGRHPRPLHLACLAAILVVLTLAGHVTAQPENPITWTLAKTPATATAGQTLRIQVTANIDAGWHVYSLTQPPGGPIATRISLPKDQPFTLDGEIDGPSPHVALDPQFNMETETYSEAKAVFTLPVKVSADASG